MINKHAMRMVLNGFAGENEKHAEGAGNEAFKLGLYVGVPGPTGSENAAKENLLRGFLVPFAVTEAEAEAGRKNSNAIEWVEVRFKETYSHFGFFTNASSFLGWGAFTVPIPVEVGDLFKIPVGGLVISAS